MGVLSDAALSRALPFYRPRPRLLIFCLHIGPYCIFIAVGIAKVKPTTARERKDRSNDFAAGLFNFRQRGLKIVTIENNQRAALCRGSDLVGLEKPAVNPLIGECRVFRAKVFKFPAKRTRKEILCLCDVLGGKFNVVNLLVLKNLS